MGIDISGHCSKSVSELAGEPFDLVVTVCDSAKEACPVQPRAKRTVHWSFDDPAAANGSTSERLAVFREVRDQIDRHVKAFLLG